MSALLSGPPPAVLAYNYDFDPYDVSTGQLPGWFFGFIIAFIIIAIVVYVWQAIAYYFVFKKAGYPRPWASWIPFYNTYVQYEVGGQIGWLFALSLVGSLISNNDNGFLSFVSVLLSIASYVFFILAAINYNKAFGKSVVGWTIFAALLPLIWITVLAFDSSRYNPRAADGPKVPGKGQTFLERAALAQPAAQFPPAYGNPAGGQPTPYGQQPSSPYGNNAPGQQNNYGTGNYGQQNNYGSNTPSAGQPGPYGQQNTPNQQQNPYGQPGQGNQNPYGQPSGQGNTAPGTGQPSQPQQSNQAQNPYGQVQPPQAPQAPQAQTPPAYGQQTPQGSPYGQAAQQQGPTAADNAQEQQPTASDQQPQHRQSPEDGENTTPPRNNNA